jgi:hypothetical protein
MPFGEYFYPGATSEHIISAVSFCIDGEWSDPADREQGALPGLRGSKLNSYKHNGPQIIPDEEHTRIKTVL